MLHAATFLYFISCHKLRSPIWCLVITEDIADITPMYPDFILSCKAPSRILGCYCARLALPHSPHANSFLFLSLHILFISSFPSRKASFLCYLECLTHFFSFRCHRDARIWAGIAHILWLIYDDDISHIDWYVYRIFPYTQMHELLYSLHARYDRNDI